MYDDDDEVIPFNDGGAEAPYRNNNENRYHNNGGNNRNYSNENFQRNNNWKGNGGGGYQRNNDWKNNSGGNNNRGNFQRNNNWKGNGGGGGGYQRREKEPEDLTLYKPYVVVANKDVPQEVISKFKQLAKELEDQGFTVRTDAADMLGSVIEAFDKCETYLPWKGFNDKISKNTWNSERSKSIAKMFHPSFDSMKPAIQAFLARNARLVLGQDLTSPSMFILVWSADGAETKIERTAQTGQVGHHIAIANAMRIPVFNLAKQDSERRLKQYLDIPYVEKQIKEF